VSEDIVAMMSEEEEEEEEQEEVEEGSEDEDVDVEEVQGEDDMEVKGSDAKKEKRQKAEGGDLASVKKTDLEGTSTMFQLQVTELLHEAGVDHKKQTKLEEFLHTLKDFMDKLPDVEVKPTKASAAYCKFLQAPATVSLKFSKPHSVALVGSYMLRTLARPQLNVDLAVEMPASCFREKDIRDHKYHIKRALYLEHLAKKAESV